MSDESASVYRAFAQIFLSKISTFLFVVLLGVLFGGVLSAAALVMDWVSGVLLRIVVTDPSDTMRVVTALFLLFSLFALFVVAIHTWEEAKAEVEESVGPEGGR